MSKFIKLSDEVVESFKKVYKSKSVAHGISLVFIGDDSLKGLVKVSKINDQYAFLLGKEEGVTVLVTINERLFFDFADDTVSIELLFEQEIDKIDFNLDSGKLKLRKPDIMTTSGIVEKHGMDALIKANGLKLILLEKKQEENE